MTRLTAAVLAGAAFFMWMDVGSAQQPSSMLRISATTVNELRSWDQYVTAQVRIGDLRVVDVEQDPSLPSRRVERMQLYYQGDRKSTRLNSSHSQISYAVFCLKKKFI